MTVIENVASFLWYPRGGGMAMGGSIQKSTGIGQEAERDGGSIDESLYSGL